MSFDLPRNARGLRFTGDVKALAEPNPPPRAGVLGKPRQRPAPPPPASVLVGRPMAPPVVTTPPPAPPSSIPVSKRHAERRADVYRQEIVPTPYIAAPPSMRPQQQQPARSVRSPHVPEVSYEEDVKTTGFDRDALDVMPGGGAFRVTRPQDPKPRAVAPIPNFRPAIVQPQIVQPRAKESKKTSGAPLLLWILASVVAGILSYKLMPEALDRVGITLEQRR